MAYKDKAQATRYKNDYARGAYDRIALQVPKGQREQLQTAAEASGQSLNSWINDAIADKLRRP